MKFDIEVILYQVLIVLFPIFVYHLFFHEKNSERRKPYAKFTLINVMTVLLAMSFPIEFVKGYYYDFRIIPFIISFVYGGTIPGVITGITLLSFRFFLGGDGFYVVVTNYSITCLVFLLMGKKIESFHKKNKILFSSIMFWANTLVVMLSLFRANQGHQIKFMLLFYSITWVCLLMVIFVMENINKQIQMQEKLQRDERLNVISQLAASVAHEVRNPMTSVKGFLQLIHRDDNLHADQKNYIRIALNELDHAQTIINDYLSLAKPNTEELSKVNISEEVYKTSELMKSYSNIQNVTIHTNIQESLYIRGNKGEIKQALVNIIKNGIEAMSTGGTLTINTFEKEEIVYIEVIDTGNGMTKDQLSRLGTPFYTTKERGTGIGLTLSYQIIHAVKGKITVVSELGKGTTFSIKFPALKEENN